MSNKTATLDLESLFSDTGFDAFSEKDAFAEFEKNLECDLARLEDRWMQFAAPCSERKTSRRSKFPSAALPAKTLPVVEMKNETKRKPK